MMSKCVMLTRHMGPLMHLTDYVVCTASLASFSAEA